MNSRAAWRAVHTAAVLAAMVVAAFGQGAATASPRGEREPAMNVVLLVIDDIRWDSLGVAGHPIVKTPHLDRLAAGGVRFTRAYVTTSICAVSRATLLTGQYMSRHGIDQFGKPLTPDAFALTYAGVLRSAGHWTGYVGKYDVGAPRPGDYDFLRAYHGRHWLDTPGGRVHVTEQNARDALDFLRARPKERPFVLSVGFFAPHAEDAAKEQYLPQEWSAAAYAGAMVPPSPLAGDRHLNALPPFLSQPANEGRIRFHWRFDTPERYQDYMLRYFRMITEVDAAIGRLVAELEAQGVLERTLIVAIGDNGYFHGDRGLADKWYPYEQALRVPLIVHDPRLPRAQRGIARDALALNIDIAPTLVAAAGAAIPAGMQGQDLAPHYLGGSPPVARDEFFYEHPTITSKNRIPSSQAVVRRDWKYVSWPEFDYEQLFDLSRDPDEVTNLAGEAAAAAQRERMRQRLAEWRARAR